MDDPHALLLSAVLRLSEDLVLAQPKYRDARSLARHRAQIYSQNGEDGVIAEIFRRIGVEKRTFVEIGVGDGDENNTRLLLESGWSGIWWEGSEAHVTAIRTHYAREIADGCLQLVHGFAARENAYDGLAKCGVALEFDLLSIDIDMNTSHVWRALHGLRPRVAVIEYNPAFTPPLDWEIEYDPRARWRGDHRFGASLVRLEKIGLELGYVLVGCELSGINAFFVRKDLVATPVAIGAPARGGAFHAPFTADHHYEPPRFAFGAIHRGHRPPTRDA